MPHPTELNPYERQTLDNVTAAVKTILNELNGGNRKLVADSILSAVITDHRTLQQAFWSAMLLAQIGYAGIGHDPRNQASVMFAKRLRELADEYDCSMGFPYI